VIIEFVVGAKKLKKKVFTSFFEGEKYFSVRKIQKKIEPPEGKPGSALLFSIKGLQI